MRAEVENQMLANYTSGSKFNYCHQKFQFCYLPCQVNFIYTAQNHKFASESFKRFLYRIGKKHITKTTIQI